MQKACRVFFIILLIGCYASVAYTAESKEQPTLQDSRKQIGNKAERGVGNLLFGWTEIPKRVVDVTKESRNPIWGLVAGVYQGTLKAFARTTSGAVDVITSPLKSDEKSFIDPASLDNVENIR